MLFPLSLSSTVSPYNKKFAVVPGKDIPCQINAVCLPVKWVPALVGAYIHDNNNNTSSVPQSSALRSYLVKLLLWIHDQFGYIYLTHVVPFFLVFHRVILQHKSCYCAQWRQQINHSPYPPCLCWNSLQSQPDLPSPEYDCRDCSGNINIIPHSFFNNNVHLSNLCRRNSILLLERMKIMEHNWS